MCSTSICKLCQDFSWTVLKSWFSTLTTPEHTEDGINGGLVCVCTPDDWDSCNFCSNKKNTGYDDYLVLRHRLALESESNAESEFTIRKNKHATAMVYLDIATSTLKSVKRGIDYGAFDHGFHFAVLGFQQSAETSLKGVISIVDGLHYQHPMLRAHSLTRLVAHLMATSTFPEEDEYIYDAAALVENYNSFVGTSACVASRYPCLESNYKANSRTNPVTRYNVRNTNEIKAACETIYMYCLRFVNRSLHLLHTEVTERPDTTFQLRVKGHWWWLHEDGYYVAKVPCFTN